MKRPVELIVALDVPAADEIASLLARLPARIAWFKVGLELFIAAGPAALGALAHAHRNVFLDLKLHDIPRTVARAVQAAARLNVSLLTVHAGGGLAMLRAAADAANECDGPAPRLLAVTALTSLGQDDLPPLGISRPLADHALALAELAVDAGIHGLVCSPLEVPALRARFGDEVLLVTPGVRPSGSDQADQKRMATPAAAVRAGADFLVVGRPILAASDPHAAAEAILREMHEAAAPE